LVFLNAMQEEYVILVNKEDDKIGLMPKMEAHEKALLHRAFSVFVFNDKNELMLQQRAINIILQAYGPIHVAVIKEMEKVILMLVRDV